MLEVIPLDESVKTGDPIFSLQGRLENVARWPGNTVHMALAFGDKDLAFQVSSTVHACSLERGKKRKFADIGT